MAFLRCVSRVRMVEIIVLGSATVSARRLSITESYATMTASWSSIGLFDLDKVVFELSQGLNQGCPVADIRRALIYEFKECPELKYQRLTPLPKRLNGVRFSECRSIREDGSFD